MSGATTNQDSYFAREDFGGFRGLNFLGVCDGHGPAGHLVSKHVSFSLSSKPCSHYRFLQYPSERLPGREQIYEDSKQPHEPRKLGLKIEAPH